MIPYVRLFAAAAAAYLLLATVWALASARHWADVGALQHAIAAIIILGLIEQVTWYLDYAAFNRTGFRPPAATLYAVIVGCARRTLCRYVAVAVAQGYAVVVPVLDSVAQGKAIALSCLYMLASSVLASLTSVGQVDDLTGGARALLGLPVAALDAVFVLWIFASLSKTLATVAARRATAKLALYRRFTNTLSVAVWASIAFIAYETYAKVTDPYAERWRADWAGAAFWAGADFAFTVAVAILFRPCPAATRFAYSDADAEAEYDTLERGNGKAGLPRLVDSGDGGEQVVGKSD